MKITKFLILYLPVIVIALVSYLNFLPSSISAIITLCYIYIIYLLGFKFLPQRNYVINFIAILMVLFIYRGLFRNFNLFGFLINLFVILQIILLLFFKPVWRRYREKITFNVSSSILKNIIEKHFKIEENIYKIEDENIELEKEKVLINKIYSQAKLINNVLKLDEILDLCDYILSDIIGLPNFGIFIKQKDGKEQFYIVKNFSSEMENYIGFLITSNKISELSQYTSNTRLDIKKESEAIKKFEIKNLTNLNFFPLLIKEEVIGGLICFDTSEKNILDDEIVKLSINIALPIIAMGIKKAILYKEMEELAEKDGLTKLYLHRVFQEKIKDEFARAKRYKTPLSLIMLDIDHFKNFNDKYGHLQGDYVLTLVAETILSNIESPIIAARYGGEEFAIICPNLNLNETYNLAEKIRKDIENKKIKLKDEEVNITISCGVAEYNEKMETKDNLIKAADIALYIAKEGGRNRTIKYT